MTVDYTVLNPTGNITILVEAPISEELQPFAASRLMEKEPEAEQTGFVGGRRLRMAGGEFCGNASMCAAALYEFRHGMKPGESSEGLFEVSGTDKPIAIKTECLGEKEFRCSVEMPTPLSARTESIFFGGRAAEVCTVDFGGIAHCIMSRSPDREAAEAEIARLCAEMKKDALGIMFLNEEEMRLDPLVYVAEPPTCFWESSCASGTAAVGAYLAAKRKEKVSVSVSEPGGKLTVTASPGGKIILTGTVRIERSRRAEIEI